MRGHIRKRGKSWAVVVELPRDPETGKRRQKWVTVRGTKKEAEKVLAEMLAKLGRGEPAVPSKMTLREFFNRFLEAKRGSVRENTLSNYRKAFRAFLRELGEETRLDQLTPLHLQGVVSVLEERVKPSSIRRYCLLVKAAFHQAVDWGLLPENPMGKVILPRDEEREMQVWNEAEVARFLEAASGNRLFALFRLALASGMRIGEIIALRWEDVDLEEGRIRVVRTVSGKGYDRPKTKRGVRTVPIDPETVRALREHKKRQAEERLRFGAGWNPENLVFCTRNGRRYCHECIIQIFDRLIEKAGVKRIRIHDLRHTHATLLLKHGVPPKVVAERLGHDVSVTMKTYAHVLPDMQAEAVKTAERCLQMFAKPRREGRKTL
ncbi:MAG: Integrase family protein [Thermoanaerobacterales bacterium 50_218]|nr:MAG: Integrase family protein [Thermoanaerobacterales bacterium 50_218]HAA89941.1 site-specific integrase [Peptococcaceae bacterium]